MLFLLRCDGLECSNKIHVDVRGDAKRINNIRLEWVCTYCNKVNIFER